MAEEQLCVSTVLRASFPENSNDSSGSLAAETLYSRLEFSNPLRFLTARCCQIAGAPTDLLFAESLKHCSFYLHALLSDRQLRKVPDETEHIA